MAGSILVTGATGLLGRQVTRRLLQLGLPVRAFTRRPEVAISLFGSSVEVAAGSFDDPASLDRALSSIDRVVLLSPLSDSLVRHQTAVIDAAERHPDVRRVVKISGSDWTIVPARVSVSGAAHVQIERRLTESRIPAVAIRPNAWMQRSLPAHIANIKTDQHVVAAYGDGAVSFVDTRDIADVVVHQLLVPELASSPVVLTGLTALSIGDIAALASRQLGRPIAVSREHAPPSRTPRGFEERAVGEFIALIRAGRAAGTSDDVVRLLGRPPRSVEAFLAEYLELLPA